MENNLPVITKKVWNLLRVAYFLLRKGISKSKLTLEFSLLIKRSKLAGKAFTNLMFHHHSPSAAVSPTRRPHDHLPFPIAADEYEFSCSNSPNGLHFLSFKRRCNHFFGACAHAPATLDDDASVLKAALELLNNNGGASVHAPPVRQLRVTDSPFPLQDPNPDSQVDKAADEFISRFYKDLMRQAEEPSQAD